MSLKGSKVTRGLECILSHYKVSCNTEATGLGEVPVMMTRG